MDSALKHCAASRKRRLSALPNVGTYIYVYMTLKFLALQGAPHIYDISRLRVKNVAAASFHILRPSLLLIIQLCC
jgi:hypothetical protein